MFATVSTQLPSISVRSRTLVYAPLQSPETDLHIAQNACHIGYANTWSLKRVHWLSKCHGPHRSTSNYGGEDTLGHKTGAARVRLQCMAMHTQVAPKSNIQWLLSPFHDSRWMDHCEVCQGSIEAISILNSAHSKDAYSHNASHHRSIQWHVRSHGWCDASLGQEEDSMEGRLVLRCEVSSTEDVQIVRWSDSNNGRSSHVCTYPRSFLEVAIIWKVGQGNRYQSWGRDLPYYPIPRGLSEVPGETILC